MVERTKAKRLSAWATPEVAGDDQDGEATVEATLVANERKERDGFE
jgi:hypothetical protein